MSASEKRPLHVCERLFECLNQDGIRYCHWKSNEHLLEASQQWIDEEWEKPKEG